MTATYTKLRDGDWGIRVVGQVVPGQAVDVTKKSGEVKMERIAKVLFVEADGASVCSIERDARGEHRAKPPTTIARQRAGNWRPCGYPGCRPGCCDECNGEGLKLSYSGRRYGR